VRLINIQFVDVHTFWPRMSSLDVGFDEDMEARITGKCRKSKGRPDNAADDKIWCTARVAFSQHFTIVRNGPPVADDLNTQEVHGGGGLDDPNS